MLYISLSRDALADDICCVEALKPLKYLIGVHWAWRHQLTAGHCLCTVLVELHFYRINVCTEKVMEGFERPYPSVFIGFNSLVLVSLTVKCVRNKPAYFAERLYKSMKVKRFCCFPPCLSMLKSIA